MAKMEKRRYAILQLLENEKVLYLSDVSHQFKLSKETVRKDFDELTKNDSVERIHGGIRLKRHAVMTEHYIFKERQLINVDSKKALAYKALTYIKDGSTIYLDSGTTVSYIFQYLNYKKNITVITPSIPLLIAYSQEATKEYFQRCGHQFIFIGGHVNHNMLTTFGPYFNKMIHHFNIDLMFLSGDAFDIHKGLSNADDVTVSIVDAVKKQSNTCIALIDETKVDKRATYQCLTLSDIDILITDHAFSKEDKEILEHSNIVHEQVITK